MEGLCQSQNTTVHVEHVSFWGALGSSGRAAGTAPEGCRGTAGWADSHFCGKAVAFAEDCCQVMVVVAPQSQVE